jgi:hypothetical protein
LIDPFIQEIFHRIKSGGLTHEESSGFERPSGKAIAVQGSVRDFETFSHQSKNHRMLARVVAGPQGMHADLASRPFASQTMTPMNQSI